MLEASRINLPRDFWHCDYIHLRALASSSTTLRSSVYLQTPKWHISVNETHYYQGLLHGVGTEASRMLSQRLRQKPEHSPLSTTTVSSSWWFKLLLRSYTKKKAQWKCKKPWTTVVQHLLTALCWAAPQLVSHAAKTVMKQQSGRPLH